MPCPVCHKEDIDPELRICPNCNTDLELYSYIGGLDKSKKKNKKQKFFFLTISVILLSAFIYFYWFGFKKMKHTNSGKNEVEMALLTKENDSQKKEISKLKDELTTLNKKISEQPANPSAVQSPIPSTPQPLKVATSKPSNPSSAKSGNTSSKHFKTHVVKEGETAFGIARMYYGNGIHYTKIVRDNNLPDATFIRIGMELKIYD